MKVHGVHCWMFDAFSLLDADKKDLESRQLPETKVCAFCSKDIGLTRASSVKRNTKKQKLKITICKFISCKKIGRLSDLT